MSDVLESSNLSPSVEHGYELLRERCGLLELHSVAVFELKGDDRKAWVQGQATNDLRGIMPGGTLQFCLCSPTGQAVATCDLFVMPDRFLILTSEACAPAVEDRLRTMIIMEDVTWRRLGDEYSVFSVQGPQTTRELNTMVELPTLDAAEAEMEGEAVITLRSNRTGYGGWDILVPSSAKKASKRLKDAFTVVDPGAYDIARLESGIPAYGRDINEKTLPPEMGQNFTIKNVSYKKGCYVGQEILMRLHSRGHTNKTWMGLYTDQMVEVGAAISHRSRPDAGVITSAVFSPQFGPIAAAMIRNELAENGEIFLIDGVEAESRHMPFLRFD